MVGQGGRQGGGEAMGEMDWWVVRHGWHASMVEVRGNGDGTPFGIRERRRARESEEANEVERERAAMTRHFTLLPGLTHGAGDGIQTPCGG